MSSTSAITGRLRRAVAAMDLAFCKLNRIQFAAPWKEPPGRRR